MKMRYAFVGIAVLFLWGCGTPQLTYDTADQADTVTDLYKAQVLNNFSRLIDDKNALPSLTDIASGTVQSTITVTPGLTFPLSPMLARSGAGILTGITTAGGGGSISGSDAALQNWTVSPVVDANSLRNFRALYRYALFGIDLGAEYHVPNQVDGKQFTPDPYFEQEPQCVLCTRKHVISKKMHPSWIYWTNDFDQVGANPPLTSEYIRLGHFGRHVLYISPSAQADGYLSDFILFLLPTPEPSAGSSAGTKGSPVAGRSNTRNVPYEIVKPTGPVGN